MRVVLLESAQTDLVALRIDRDYAAFGEASFDILENLTLTAGGRLFKYDNSLIGFFGFGRNPAGPPFNGAGSSRTGVAGCFNSDGTTVRNNPGGFCRLPWPVRPAPISRHSPMAHLNPNRPPATVSPTGST